jgi:hypothetical protein
MWTWRASPHICATSEAIKALAQPVPGQDMRQQKQSDLPLIPLADPRVTKTEGPRQSGSAPSLRIFR